MPRDNPCRRVLALAVLALLAGSAGGLGQQSGNVTLWVEREVAISFGGITLHGVLTLPPTGAPHPALVLIDGAAGPDGRQGVGAWMFVTHAHQLAAHGFASLRYDPPGVGRSGGQRGIDSLESRTTEALAVAECLRGQSDVDPGHVGLWGVSQGGWVIAMAAAQSPEAIDFLVMVSGTTVSVAEQQVYGVEAQSRAAGIAGDDLAKAVLVARLLIDWQLPSPVFQAESEAAVARLGDGPWVDFAQIVYGDVSLSPAEELGQVIGILESIAALPWAGSLYLEELYIPNLRRIPVTEWAALQEGAAETLLADPKGYFEHVTCPILALFGEDDLNVPVTRTVELLKQYMTTAENDELAIVIFPDAGHSLNDFMPAYWTAFYAWLDALETSWSKRGG